MDTREQVKRAFDAIVKASEVDEALLKSKTRRFDAYTARGVYFLLCRELGLHPSLYGSYIGRSRTSTVITTKRYHGYYLSKDKFVTALIDKARKIYYGE